MIHNSLSGYNSICLQMSGTCLLEDLYNLYYFYFLLKCSAPIDGFYQGRNLA